MQWRRGCVPANICSRSLTMCTSQAVLSGQWTLASFWKKKCGGTPRSDSTSGKQWSGTRVVLPQRVLKLWRRQPEEWTQRLWYPDLPTDRQGVVVLGTPVGHPEFVSRVLEQKTQEHSTLLERIPAVQDLQSAWVLLSYCAAARANFWLRTTSPAHTEVFAQEHDKGISKFLCQLLHVDPDSVSPSATAAASLPLSSGGLGLRSATRLRGAAHWASWADSLKMVFDRHPDIARRIVRGLEGHHPAPGIQAVLDCASSLTRDGFRPAPWEDLMQQEPEPSRENAEPGQPRKG